MILSDRFLSYIRNARLANHALSAAPAWLWSADATRVLWANAAGAALLGAASPHALAERRMSATQPLAAQVLRLAGTLPHGGAPRLERLRGIGARVGRTVACACSRFALANGMPAILIPAAEALRPAPPAAPPAPPPAGHAGAARGARRPGAPAAQAPPWAPPGPPAPGRPRGPRGAADPEPERAAEPAIAPVSAAAAPPAAAAATEANEP